jgi:hypothetical protein
MLGGIPALVFENGKPSDNYTQVKVFLAPEVSEGGLVIGVWVAPAPLGSVRGEEASQDKPKEAPTVELILVLPDGMPIGPAVTISQGKEETVQFPLTEKAREVLRGIQNVDLPALPFRFVVRYGSASGAVSAKESPA